MLLAEIEIRHSRSVAPTRRVALGAHWLPTDPPPGYGPALLGLVVAARLGDLDEDDRSEFGRLVDDLEAGRRIVQPRLRHRFQTDVVGLERSRHTLEEGPGRLPVYRAEVRSGPGPQLLGAAYAVGQLHPQVRLSAFRAIRLAASWEEGLGPTLIKMLCNPDQSAVSWRRFATDERWALTVLGFGPGCEPERTEVLSRFRQLVREQHPDHGAETDGAGQRIVELTEARRILLL
ncbi:MAG: hypothetical protein ACT4OS_10915 [Acidimicrobiales bacterium]